MVKIINTLGDVKTGKQGTAIYQRKYGQQMRSVTSTMRATSSQRQLAHRQLYRDALAWRKGLSRQNRRYLVGYCIANGVIDRFGIPLAWSRFAIKIYLEAIKFVVITKSIIVRFIEQDTATEEQTSYISSYPLYSTFVGRMGQSIDIPDRLISKLAIRIYRYGSPTGDVTFTIRDYSTDAIVASKVWGDAADLPVAKAFREVEFNEPVQVNGWHRLLCEFYGGDASNCVYVEMAILEAKPGEYCSYWKAGVYTNKMVWDVGYIYTYLIGDPYEGEIDWTKSKEGLLHVRHPALLIVVQRRGGEVLTSYDTLSSLDDEYLTGQVGLDTQTGDIIEATTLAGVAYQRQV